MTTPRVPIGGERLYGQTNEVITKERKPRPKAPPCLVCKRCHRGPRCKPEDKRTVRTCFSLPAHVRKALEENVFYGDRSAYIADLIEKDLM